MDLKTELEKILEQYKKNHGNGRKCDYVMFFQDEPEDEVDHLLCFSEQLPAIESYVKWYKPHFISVSPFGMPVYSYFADADPELHDEGGK